MVSVVEAARAGDTAAQDELVAAYLPLVYNIVGRALKGHADTDDVVQETMLRVINGLPALRDAAGFRSWLVAITMNQIRGHWRTERPETPVSGLQELGEVPDPEGDFVSLTILRLGLEGQRKEVAEATRWLDEDEQDALSLWWLEAAGELTRAELAAALELSPQHAAVRVQRVKAQLDVARGVVRALAADPLCPRLADAVAPWDGVPSPLWRKRAARHVRGCGRCTGALSALVPAEGLLVGLGLVPVAGALLGWWGSGAVLRTQAAGHTAGADRDSAGQSAGQPGGTGGHGAGTGAAGRHRTGATSGHRRPRTRKRAAAGAAALVVAGAAVLGGLYLFTDSPDNGRIPRAGAAQGEMKALDASTSALPPSTSASPSAPASASAPASEPASPSNSPSATRSPSASESASRAPETDSPKQPSGETDRSVTAGPRPRRSAPQPPADPGGGPLAQQVTNLVNAERAKAGCGSVRLNAQLTQAAQRHSDDMAARNFFDHTNPDGKGPGDRITAAGYRWSTYGENIAYGQQTPASVMDSWMHSDGHRRNIRNCAFDEIGVGVNQAPGGPRWTQVFGAR
ncbi:sigma-70 family RNA polymerase sigma factor [Streptomyces gamaensis]|uniref:RNA polymerase sigma factor n=1 Tax=Streptomyces gamaensis TaxID=1763542 RepID=A0ABW0YYH5_9ACTN